MLGCKPAEVMMVAAHVGDLQAARESGLRTGFVPRPLERGPASPTDPQKVEWVDVTGADFLDLATKLT